MQSDRFAWLLHRSAADVLLAEPDRVRGAAKARLEQQRAREGAKAEAELWDAWEVLLDGPVGDLVAVMIGLDERSMQLRTTTPFVGIVGEERRAAALAGSKAA